MSHAPAPEPSKRLCPECAAPVPRGALYCAPVCRHTFHNRMSKRGRVILPVALGWRGKRGTGDVAKRAFAELCAYLDACNAEDFAAGRPPMIRYLEAMFAHTGGVRWRDRR